MLCGMYQILIAGEVLSYKLGITTPKYQSEIEEAARMEAEEVLYNMDLVALKRNQRS